MTPRVLLVLCLAGCEKQPKREPPPPPPPKLEPIDIMLAIDLSKSMEETDLPPDRLGATQAALRGFVATRSRDRIGIVIYAQKAKRIAALTGDRRAIDETIATMRIGDVAELGTAIGDGLALAVDELVPSTAKRKAIVLFGDGDNNWVTRFDPEQAAAAAKQGGVTVYTMVVGSEDPGVFGGMATNPKTFQNIAATTGGAFYSAVDPPSFERGLREIGAKLDASARVSP